jgi:hypothetical protein
MRKEAENVHRRNPIMTSNYRIAAEKLTQPVPASFGLHTGILESYKKGPPKRVELRILIQTFTPSHSQ